MNRLLLIALLFVFVWYLWWRVRRRFAGRPLPNPAWPLP